MRKSLSSMLAVSLTMIVFLYGCGNREVQLTKEGQKSQPTCSSDGKQIAFMSSNNIWVMNTDGSNMKQISQMPSGRGAWGPEFHPSNSSLIYMDNSPNGLDFHWIVIAMQNEGSSRIEVQQVPGGEGFSPPKYSPDGKYYCYIHNSRTPAIKVAQSDGSNIKTIKSDSSLADTVRWGRGNNSNKLLYGKKIGDIVSLYTIGIDGKNETRISPQNMGNCTNGTWSPDGKTIAFTSDNKQIYLINSDGTNVKQLTNDIFENIEPAFSSDGKEIVYISNRNGSKNIYKIKYKKWFL